VAARSAALSPEVQLVLVTTAVRPRDASLREALRSEIDWDELNALLRHERAASVLLRHLDRVGAGNQGGQELRQLATMSVMQMLRLEQLLHQTIDIFAQHGIETMLLKGAGLAYTAYPSFADRPMGDLDLLVRPGHARRAWSLLQAHGWLLSNGAQIGRFTGHHHLPPLFQETRTFRIEIQKTRGSGSRAPRCFFLPTMTCECIHAGWLRTTSCFREMAETHRCSLVVR